MWTSTGTGLQGLRGPSPTAQDPWGTLPQQGGLIHGVPHNTWLEFTTRRLVKQPVYLDSELSVTELCPGPASLPYATITSSSTGQPQGQPWGLDPSCRPMPIQGGAQVCHAWGSVN